MNLQEVYDRVVTHLMTQAKKSMRSEFIRNGMPEEGSLECVPRTRWNYVRGGLSDF